MRWTFAPLLALALAACGQARPYPSESGVIVYENLGRYGGDETIMWDDWGMRSVTVTNGFSNRGRDPRQSRMIMTPNATFIYASDRTGYMKVAAGSRRAFSRGDGRDSELYVAVGPDTVAGVACESVRARNPALQTEICMSGHLLLRLIAPNRGKIATRIDLDVEIDPAVFEPDGQMMLELSPAQLHRMMFLGG